MVYTFHSVLARGWRRGRLMIAGDAVLYYPAQSVSSLVVYEKGYLTAPEIFRFGVWMTFLAFFVVLAIALPYWGALGESLRVL